MSSYMHPWMSIKLASRRPSKRFFFYSHYSFHVSGIAYLFSLFSFIDCIIWGPFFRCLECQKLLLKGVLKLRELKVLCPLKQQLETRISSYDSQSLEVQGHVLPLLSCEYIFVLDMKVLVHQFQLDQLSGVGDFERSIPLCPDGNLSPSDTKSGPTRGSIWIPPCRAYSVFEPTLCLMGISPHHETKGFPFKRVLSCFASCFHTKWLHCLQV